MRSMIQSWKTPLMLLLLIGAWGCGEVRDSLPLGVDAEFAKGGNAAEEDPVVELVEPNVAPQDTTVDIEVSGSGFDAGSQVELGLAGVPSSEVKTNSTKVVNSKRLVANITISALAQQADYDVIVITGRGKKGIGTELFRVVQKSDNGNSGPELLSVTVEQVSISEPVSLTGVPEVDAFIADTTALDLFPSGYGPSTFFGCPDPSQPCNRVVATFQASGYKAVTLLVQPVAEGCRLPDPDPEGGCIYAEEIEDRRNLATFFEASHPDLPFDVVRDTPALVENPDGSMSLTVYWQGQRGRRLWSDNTYMGRGWSLYQDLGRQGQPDRFVFFLGLLQASGAGTYVGGSLYIDCPPTGPESCVALHQGAPSDRIYLVWDHVGMVTETSGRGKKATTTSYFSIRVSGFLEDPATLPHDEEGLDYLDPLTIAANPKAWFTAILTPPTGVTRVFRSGASGSSTSYELPFAHGFGCYEVRMLDGISTESRFERLDQIYGTWQWEAPAEIRTLRIDHTAAGTTWELGGTCGG